MPQVRMWERLQSSHVHLLVGVGDTDTIHTAVIITALLLILMSSSIQNHSCSSRGVKCFVTTISQHEIHVIQLYREKIIIMNYCQTSPIGDKAGRGKSQAHSGLTLDNHFKKNYRCNRPCKTQTPRGCRDFCLSVCHKLRGDFCWAKITLFLPSWFQCVRSTSLRYPVGSRRVIGS